MTKLYNTYRERFDAVRTLAAKYALPTEKLEQAIAEIEDFKVTVPLIGGFSTGKSSILNTLLGRELLSTNITPETAVPTEISYGQDSVIYCTENGETTGSVEDLHTDTLQADRIDLVKVTLNNEFLKRIPAVKLVDMPGFDSGYEVHNRAIDAYLPKSLAYIITVSADEGTLRESVLNFLNELKLNDMDVYVVITKSDKIMPEELEGVVVHVRELVEQKMQLQDVRIAVTSADLEEADEFKEILLELQANSERIFQRNYSQKLCGQLTNIRSYLIKQLNRKDMDTQQLADDKDLLEAQVADLQRNVEEEKERFRVQAERCVSAIQQKVESDLRGNSGTLENMLMQGNSIQEKVNFIVRNAVTVEINRQLEPKIRHYVENVSGMMQTAAFQTDVNSPLLNQSVIEENEQLRSTLQSITAPAATIIGSVVTGSLGTSIATALGITSTILGPLGMIVGGIAGALLGSFINKGICEKEEQQKRDAARQRVNEVIADVAGSIGSRIEASIYEITNKINAEIDAAITEQITLQRKALADLEEKIHQSEQDRRTMELTLTADLQEVEAMLKQEGALSNA